jgi:HEAT repeat protein
MASRDQILHWLRPVDLSKLALTAAIDGNGKLRQVGGLWEQLSAAAQEAGRMGLLRAVATSADQNDVPEPLKDPNASPLQVLQGESVEVILQRLYEEHGPRAAVRRYERHACGKLELPDRKVPIEKLYQPLPLLREVKDKARDLPHERFHGRREREEAAASEYRGIEIQRWEEEVLRKLANHTHHTLDEVFTAFGRLVADAKSDVPRFVVVGPPGSGKSTLVQNLAYQATAASEEEKPLRLGDRRLLPVQVRLQDWERWVTKDREPNLSLADYLGELYRQKNVWPAPTSDQWFRYLAHGDVLLLLDGLDEAEGKPEFRAALQAVLSLFETCPTVLTCRTVSFELHQKWCSDLPAVFVLGGLDDVQRDSYIRGFAAHHADNYDPERLIDQLDHLPVMRPLAANPLLLSIICFVVDDPSPQGVKLPATRGELYDQAVNKLLMRFDDNFERVKVNYPGAAPKSEEKRVLIERAALELFAGNDRRSLTFTGVELGRALRVALKEQGYGDATAPWANALRDDLTQNSGLLRADAAQNYFFIHPTIQEFLAASCLARAVNDRDGWQATIELNRSCRTVCEWVDKKAWDPRWQEVVCLLVGRLTDPAYVLKMLSERELTSTNPIGDDVFRHRLTLAALSLPELPEQVRRAQRKWINDITTAVFDLYWDALMKPTDHALHQHLGRVMPALGFVNGTVRGVRGSRNYGTENASRHESTDGERSLLDQVADLLASPNDAVRLSAVKLTEGLGQVVVGHARLVLHLIDSLRHPTAEVRQAVLLCLDGLDLVSRAASHGLLHFQLTNLINDLDEDVRSTAERLFWLVSSKSPVFPNLIVYLFHDSNPNTRQDALRVIGELGAAQANHRIIMDNLLELLRDRNAQVREAAADAVGRLGRMSASTQPLLLLVRLFDLLHDDDLNVQGAATTAIAALGGIVVHHPLILDRLIEMLHDRHLPAWLGEEAAMAIGRLGTTVSTNPWMLDRLTEMLRDSRVSARASAAMAVGMMPGVIVNRPEILNRLVELLNDSRASARASAAAAVGQLSAIVANHSSILDRLTTLLSSGFAHFSGRDRLCVDN